VSTVPDRPAAYIRVEDAAFADDMTWRRGQVIGAARDLGWLVPAVYADVGQPGSRYAALVEAVAVGLDEEATLYGRGAENYDRADGYRAGSYGGGAENYGRPESYAPGTGDHGRQGTGNGTRPSGPRHAAKQRS